MASNTPNNSSGSSQARILTQTEGRSSSPSPATLPTLTADHLVYSAALVPRCATQVRRLAYNLHSHSDSSSQSQGPNERVSPEAKATGLAHAMHFGSGMAPCLVWLGSFPPLVHEADGALRCLGWPGGNVTGDDDSKRLEGFLTGKMPIYRVVLEKMLPFLASNVLAADERYKASGDEEDGWSPVVDDYPDRSRYVDRSLTSQQFDGRNTSSGVGTQGVPFFQRPNTYPARQGQPFFQLTDTVPEVKVEDTFATFILRVLVWIYRYSQPLPLPTLSSAPDSDSDSGNAGASAGAQAWQAQEQASTFFRRKVHVKEQIWILFHILLLRQCEEQGRIRRGMGVRERGRMK